MLLDDMSTYLAAGGIGLTAGTNLFLGSLPDSPDRAVALHEYGGMPPVHANARQAAVVERPRFQVLARALTYQGARQLAHNVYTRLDSIRGDTINSTFYHWVSALQSPFSIGPDGSARHQIVFNCEVIKQVTSSTST